MTTRTPADSERWMEHGTKIFLETLSGIDDASLAEPLALPGWTGKHLVAHVAANAEALSNLVHWASTGVETPMYSSPEQRDADIESGSRRTAPALREWVAEASARLSAGYARLGSEQRGRQVSTAHGRVVPATEIGWLRAREVMVHAVDLGRGVSFADLPADFLPCLAEDIVAKRSATRGPAVLLVPADAPGSWELPGNDEPVEITAPLAELTAYLAGRPSALDGTGAPELHRWL